VLDRLGGRDRVIASLAATVVVGIGVWILTEAAFYLAIFGYGGNDPLSTWTRWAQIVSRVAFVVWLGALALLFLLWLLTQLRASSTTSTDHDGPGRDTDLRASHSPRSDV
jgi:hypothetical protein